MSTNKNKITEKELTENFTKVGHVSDGHGLRGDLYILIRSGDISWIDDLDELVLTSSTNMFEIKTFKIKKIKPFKKGFIAQVEGVTDRTQADLLKKYDVWADSEFFISEDGEQPYLSELLNFTIEDKQLGKIGAIQNFSSNGMQDLFVIDKQVNGQNIEIPFVEEFVLDINYDAKKILMDLPEGLISINEKD